MRLWQSRTWATFTVVVTPPMTTISWLQIPWWIATGTLEE
jgi:hypothetical protein